MSGISEDDDLSVVWPRIIAACNEKAGWDLDSKAPPSIDGILANIKPPKHDKSGIQVQAAKVFKKTLVVIERFGAIVAQGASAAFPATGQCFNAISFVIGAVQKYDEVFSNVATLVERVSAFMENLQMYLDQKLKDGQTMLEKGLRVSIYRVLEHFLTILGIWHKLTTRKSAKFTLAVKVVVFGEDGGVKGAINLLETLVTQVTRAQVTAITVNLSAAAQNIQIVEEKLDKLGEAVERIEDASEKTVSSLGRLESAEEERKRLSDIREALNLDAGKNPWQDKQDELWGTHVAGSGKWLLEYNISSIATNSFTRWSDPRSKHIGALGLVAEERYGKSYLCGTVVNHLRERHSDNPKVGLAYYYLQRETSDRNRINVAMKAIVYQLASASTSIGREYARLVRKACNNKGEFGNTIVLWNKLVMEPAKALDATFFIVLDGIDEAEAESDKPLAAIIAQVMAIGPGSPFQIRLFFSGRPSGLDALRDLSKPAPEIRIVQDDNERSLNQDDIFLYAQAQLDKMRIFETDDEKISELKERAKAELGAGVKGDYYALDSKLESLSRSRTINDIETVLSRAKETRRDEIARDVDLLNETLREDEIQELNELLSWDAVSFEGLSVSQYKAILKLKAKNVALITLETQIKERYFRMFKIDDRPNDVDRRMVILKSADIREHLQNLDEQASRDKETQSGSRAAIQEGEIALVSRILKTHFKNIFGDDDMYDKFAFDDFFKDKRGSETASIRLSSDLENHVKVGLGCLVTVCDHIQDPEYASLLPYAKEYFAAHLKEGRDVKDSAWIADVNPATKQEIGRKLVRMLREPTLIDAWLSHEEYWVRIDAWAFEATHTKSLYRWLKDPTVQKGLQDMPSDRQWVLENTVDDEPSVKILVDAVKRLAIHWFDFRTHDSWLWCLMMIIGYLGNMRGTEVSVREQPSVEQVESAEIWAKEALGNHDQEAKWHTCIAESLLRTWHAKEAVGRYRRALSLGETDWRLRHGLAKALEEDDQTQEAITEIEQLISQNQERLTLTEDDDFKTEYWNSIIGQLARCYVGVKDFTKAEEAYRSILAEAFERKVFADWAMDAVFSLAQTLNDQDRYADTIQLLDDLAGHSEGAAGDWLCIMLNNYGRGTELHAQVSKAANGANQLEKVMEKYQAAIEVARSDQTKFSALFHLRRAFGSFLRCHNSETQRELALKIWEENMCEEVSEDNDDAYEVKWAQGATAPLLCQALLDSARSAGLTLPLNSDAQSYLERLEAVVSFDDKDPGRWTYTTIKLALIRLHGLSGNREKALGVSREQAKKGLEEAEDEPSTARDALYSIANIMQVLGNDDLNALAAWHAFAPPAARPKDTAAPLPDRAAVDVPQEALELGTSADSPAKDNVSGTENQAVAKAAVEVSGHNSIEAAVSDDQDNSHKTGDKSEPENLKSSDELDASRYVSGTCDACETGWDEHGIIYACRDCFDTHFCPQCYQKMQDGLLDGKFCSKAHDHLKVEFLDMETWKTIPEDQMLVGGKLISRKDWLESMRKMWQVDEESLAAQKIQSAWRGFRGGAPGPGIKRTQTAPLS